MNELKVKEGPMAQPDTMLSLIARAAQDPNIDIDKMERLMVMKREMDAEQAKQAFNRAMKSAQEEMRTIGTNKFNGQTKSHYTTMEKLDGAIRPIYTKYGFSLSYDTGEAQREGEIRLLCTVAHTDGHEKVFKIDMPADGKGAKGGDVMTKTHAVGSASTYGRRYLLKMIFNIQEGEKDDDGNGATGMECISEDQAAAIRQLIEETGADIRKFCDFYKVDAVSSIPAKRFDGVMRDLNQKKAAEARKHGSA